MSQIVSGDFAASLIYKAHEVSSERYGERVADSKIPLIFDVQPISMMSDGIFHRESMVVRDGVPEERQMGEAIEPGSMREELYALCRRRFVARSYDIPREMLEYAQMGASNALGSIERWAQNQAAEFSSDRYEAEQRFAASIFNQGAFTAGSDVFDNSVRGVAQDSGGKLCYDSKPLFNLTGNARTAVSGTTFYNAVALDFSGENLGTLENLVADTNGYTENGERLANMPNIIVGGQSQRKAFTEVLEARAKAGTANNDANAFASYTPVIWEYITDADGWAIGKAGYGLRFFQDDQPPTIEFQYDAKRRTDCLFIQSCYGAYVRPSGWRYWGASNLPTS